MEIKTENDNTPAWHEFRMSGRQLWLIAVVGLFISYIAPASWWEIAGIKSVLFTVAMLSFNTLPFFTINLLIPKAKSGGYKIIRLIAVLVLGALLWAPITYFSALWMQLH